MDAKLHDAVITNVRGTAEMIKIAKGMQDLQAFLLVSTAYSNCKEKIIEERFYESPMDAELLISMAEQLDGDFLNKLSTTKDMERLPQVYNFSADKSKLLVPMDNFADFTQLKYMHFKAAIWYEVLFLVKSKYIYEVVKFLVQTIPALRKVNARLNKIASVLSYFLLNEWNIESKNVFGIWQKLNANDRELFRFDLNSIETRTYYTNLMNGLKKYTLKEDTSEYRCRQEVNRSRYNSCRFQCLQDVFIIQVCGKY
nr:unnamed protein product [Callosobruchus chinensis]